MTGTFSLPRLFGQGCASTTITEKIVLSPKYEYFHSDRLLAHKLLDFLQLSGTLLAIGKKVDTRIVPEGGPLRSTTGKNGAAVATNADALAEQCPRPR